jgi:hypothetical protein
MISNLKNIWKILPVFVTAVLVATFAYAGSSKGMKGDITGEMKMKAGAETMISAEHMITASLEKHGLMKNPIIEKGNAMLLDGEKMILEGKTMMQNSENRIVGKEMMMNGSTKMMEGKDVIVKELKDKEMFTSAAFKEDKMELVNGENRMLKGKNLMMDGERNFK